VRNEGNSGKGRKLRERRIADERVDVSGSGADGWKALLNAVRMSIGLIGARSRGEEI